MLKTEEQYLINIQADSQNKVYTYMLLTLHYSDQWTFLLSNLLGLHFGGK